MGALDTVLMVLLIIVGLAFLIGAIMVAGLLPLGFFLLPGLELIIFMEFWIGLIFILLGAKLAMDGD